MAEGEGSSAPALPSLEPVVREAVESVLDAFVEEQKGTVSALETLSAAHAAVTQDYEVLAKSMDRVDEFSKQTKEQQDRVHEQLKALDDLEDTVGELEKLAARLDARTYELDAALSSTS